MRVNMAGRVLSSAVLLAATVDAVVYSDSGNGCYCAMTRSLLTTGTAFSNQSLGCQAFNRASRYCLVDQRNSTGSCGTFDPDVNGYIDGCTQAAYSNFGISPVELLTDSSQAANTFYTFQDIAFTWNPVNVDDNARIFFTSNTNSLRTLTGGTNATLGTFRGRISESANNFAINVPVYIASSNNNPTNLINSTANTTINVLMSAAGNITAQNAETGRPIIYNNGGSYVGTNVTAGEVVNVQWQATGYARYGSVTVQLRRWSQQSGPWGAVTVPLTGSATPIVYNYTIPAGSGPNNNYYLQTVITMPNGAQFSSQSTPGSVWFVMISPTPTPTPTPSPTSSMTASPTSSKTPTPSPSESRTPTPSQTPTQTPSSTVSESARPTIDIAAIVKSANEAGGTSTGPIIGAVLGTAVAFVGGFLGYMAYQRHKLTAARLRKLKESAQWASSSHDVYFGKNGAPPEASAPSAGPPPPMIVYQVAGRGGGGGAPRSSLTSVTNPASAAAAYRSPTPAAAAGGQGARRGYAPTSAR